jgi:hypothetical protein
MKKYFLAVLLLIAGFPALAQNRNIIVLDGKPAQSGKKKMSSSHSNYPTMAVKVAALNFIAGNMPLCFEKEHNNFALLVGAGPTFRRFYDNSILSGLMDEGDETYSWGKKEDLYNVHNPFEVLGEDRKIKYSTGYYFVACPRYYYNEEGLEGGPYIGVQVTMTQYNYKNQNYDETAFDKAGRDRYTDLMLLIGGNYGGERVIFEWFSGAGIRFKDQQRYAYGFDAGSSLVEGTASIKKASVHFELGLRIGVIF